MLHYLWPKDNKAQEFQWEIPIQYLQIYQMYLKEKKERYKNLFISLCEKF